MPTRILIADDHAIFRSGLRALLEKERDLEVVAETGNGFETIQAVAVHQVNMLLLDLSMPGLPGTRVAETVRKEHSRVAIVLLTMHEDDYYLRELFGLGVRAFILKKSTGTDLLRAIRAVSRGEEYVDPSLAGRVISSYVNPTVAQTKGRLDLLTRREQEDCTLLAYGHTNTEIADQLCISVQTVESHRSNLISKLGSNTRAELVRFAIENSLMKSD